MSDGSRRGKAEGPAGTIKLEQLGPALLAGEWGGSRGSFRATPLRPPPPPCPAVLRGGFHPHRRLRG